MASLVFVNPRTQWRVDRAQLSQCWVSQKVGEMPMERQRKDAGFVLLRMIFVVCVLKYPFFKAYPARIKEV